MNREFILGKCQCGCLEDIPIRSKNGHLQRYKFGHINKNRLGSNAIAWKGDEAKKGAIHVFVRRIKPEPELCEMCNKNKPIDLANISGNYLRDIDDWWYLCRKCHMLSDGRISNLVQNNPDPIIRSKAVSKAWDTRRNV